MKSRSVQGRFALAVMFVALVAGCSSAGEKTSTGDKASTADGTEAASSTEAFARRDPAAFAERMKDPQAAVINVHIPYEGELEQTDAFIPYDKILGDSRLPKDKNTEILLYCRSGRMSEEAGAALHEDGYTKVAHLEGGMKAWEAAGRKLVHDPAHATEEKPPMQHS
ncbi:MAG: rhodanese-like domain-containing protein [Acidimicrobiia bacterium]